MPILTLEQALTSPVALGWNLRCNLCGSHGAEWFVGQRPGWGSLALCPEHAAELKKELERHDAEMRRLRTINFEQLYPHEIEQRVKALNREWSRRRKTPP